ncbi:MAG: hypothetical protein ABII76_28395 [Pseudomonadota bacterium]|jgi:hypothetical protein|nr:hypothetical protein [Xanthobacteraceae bacterium]
MSTTGIMKSEAIGREPPRGPLGAGRFVTRDEGRRILNARPERGADSAL